MGEWSSSEVALEALVFPAYRSVMAGSAARQGQTDVSFQASAKLSPRWFYHVMGL